MIKEDRKSKKQAQIKSRAIPAAVILFIVGAVLLFEGKPRFYIPWIFSLYFLVGALFYPAILAPVDILVQTFLKALAWIITRLLLLFVFAFFITPLGIWFRITGKSRLDFKFPGDKDSYWRRRSPEDQNPRCDKQY